MQLYSKGCEYAIKALLHMKEQGKNYGARAICRKARIPESFSRKVFQSLVRGDFLEAISGPGGGYRLKNHPKEISILDIVKAVDGEKAYDQCVMGLSKCQNSNPCVLHESWQNTKKKLTSELGTKYLQDLMDQQEKK